ncbi:MAG: hypothetical protein ABIH11_02260 [Candidatus Altiarchaeota archaeon]
MSNSLSRRGQSSIEFLMTYGWAILVIVIAVIVAWQWGFFSIGETVKPGSFGFWGVVPNDFVMTQDGTLYVSLLNTVGSNVTVLYYNASMGGFTDDCGSCAPLLIPAGESRLQTMRDLSPGNPGTRFELYMVIDYYDNRSDHTHRSSGKIWGNYEI